jgi:hypothetical protein
MASAAEVELLAGVRRAKPDGIACDRNTSPQRHGDTEKTQKDQNLKSTELTEATEKSSHRADHRGDDPVPAKREGYF